MNEWIIIWERKEEHISNAARKIQSESNNVSPGSSTFLRRLVHSQLLLYSYWSGTILISSITGRHIPQSINGLPLSYYCFAQHRHPSAARFALVHFSSASSQPFLVAAPPQRLAVAPISDFFLDMMYAYVIVNVNRIECESYDAWLFMSLCVKMFKIVSPTAHFFR